MSGTLADSHECVQSSNLQWLTITACILTSVEHTSSNVWLMFSILSILNYKTFKFFLNILFLLYTSKVKKKIKPSSYILEWRRYHESAKDFLSPPLQYILPLSSAAMNEYVCRLEDNATSSHQSSILLCPSAESLDQRAYL